MLCFVISHTITTPFEIPIMYPDTTDKSDGTVSPVTSEGTFDGLLFDEWVECTKCCKWRRLPSHVAHDSLPEGWECLMTNWKSIYVNCSVDEEVYGGRDTVGGGVDGGSVSVPYVLSYRIIFGLS